MLTLVLEAVIFFFASFTHTAVGFGFSLVATPFLLFVLEPKSVIVLVLLLASVNNVTRLFYLWRHIDKRRTALMLLGAALGIPLGAYIISILDPSAIKVVIGVMIIPSSIAILIGHSYHFKNQVLGHMVAGFLSGGLSSSTSLGGPPLVLFLLSERMEKQQYNATLAVLLLFNSMVTSASFLATGMVMTSILKDALIFIPVVLLGSYAGMRVFNKLSPAFFRKLAAGVVCISAMAIVVTTLLSS